MKTLITAILLMASSVAFSQKDSTYKFAEVLGYEKMMSAKIQIVVDSGQITKAMKDYRAKQSDGKFMEFYGITGALNYMSKCGWTFINAFPMATGNGNVYHFYFKKLVPVSEIPAQISNE